MNRIVGFVLLYGFFGSAVAMAEVLPVGSNLTLQLPQLQERWQVFQSAPEFLIKETAEHLGHELEAEGKQPPEEQIRQAAVKRLAANEGFICNPATGACLVIDFSPLRPDEKSPGNRQVKASARYAAEGLADEEGLSDLQQKTAPANISGARHASRIDATYHQHGEPRQFIGYVGFAEPSWFYLYYTDPLEDPVDLQQMEQILESISIGRGDR